MKRLVITAVAVCVVLAGTMTATAAQTPMKHGDSIQAPPIPETCLAQSFEGFAAAVWDIDRWPRGAPSGKEISSARDRLGCAPSSSHLDAMKADWKADKERFGSYRLYRQSAPYSTAAYGYDVGHGPRGPADLRYVAIDPNVVCGESGFDFYVNGDGLYQIIPSTWAAYGGGEFSSTAAGATPLQQHIVAHRAWGNTSWYGLC